MRDVFQSVEGSLHALEVGRNLAQPFHGFVAEVKSPQERNQFLDSDPVAPRIHNDTRDTDDCDKLHQGSDCALVLENLELPFHQLPYASPHPGHLVILQIEGADLP